MALETYADNASTAVTSGGTQAITGSETWTVASSLSFPAITAGVTQFHVIDPAQPSEKILVTAVSGNSWTVTRAVEGTTPAQHAAGFTVVQSVTAGALGQMVDLASPQVVAAKTLKGTGETSQSLTIATTAVIDPAQGNVISAVITGDTALSFASPAAGQSVSFTLYLQQDGTGGHAVTWPGSVQWIGGSAPTLPTGAGAVNVLVFETFTGGSPWYGFAVTGGPVLPLTVTNGGSGLPSLTPYALLAGGTSATGVLQQVAALGTAGWALTSNGAGALPSFQAISATSISGIAVAGNPGNNPGWTLQLVDGSDAAFAPAASPAPRVVTLTATSSTYTPNAATTDIALITTPAASFTVANPTGTPVDGQLLMLRVKSGTAFTPSWGTSYKGGVSIPLPNTLTASATDYFGFAYNATNAVWNLIAYAAGY